MSFDKLRILACAALASVGLTNCEITTCEGNDCSGVFSEKETECGRLCARLVDCGRIAGGDRAGCMDRCERDMDRREDATEELCECVEETSCSDLLDDTCGEPPVTSPPPDPDPDPDPDPPPGSCASDDDCAVSEGCIDGTCRARCAASCECRRGDVCAEGFCAGQPPAAMSCATDCDCPSGSQCLDATCQSAPAG